MRASRLTGSTFALLVSLLAAACAPAVPAGTTPATASPGAGAATTQAPTPTAIAAVESVTVAHVPIFAFSPLYAAIERGHMNEQGIQVTLQRVASGTDAAGFLASGQIDVGAVGLAAGIFNGFNRGFDMRIVGTSAAWGPTADTLILGVAGKVKSGELAKLADLKGKKVAVAGGRGSAGAYLLDAAMRPVGLTAQDVQVVSLPNADMPVALKNGAVDAALASPPFSTQALNEGWGVTLAKDWIPGASTTQFIASGKFLRERPQVAERFLIALMKGARSIQGASLTSTESLAILEKHLGAKPEVLRAAAPLVFPPDLTIAKESIAKQEQAHREAGWTDYQAALGLEKMVDDSYRQRAAARLGAYRP